MRPHYGDDENRTRDPLLARQVLSHLSYTPVYSHGILKIEHTLLYKILQELLRFYSPFSLERR